jgi:hypothetical protein
VFESCGDRAHFTWLSGRYVPKRLDRFGTAMLTECLHDFFLVARFAGWEIRCGPTNSTYSSDVPHNRPSTNSTNVAMVARIGVLMASCRRQFGGDPVKRSRALQTKQDAPAKYVGL